MTSHGVTDFLSAFHDVGIVFFDLERDLLVVLDPDGNIERVNPAFEKVLDRPEQEVIGLSFTRLVVLEDFARVMRAFDRVAHAAPFRLLHHTAGEVPVRLVDYRFKTWPIGNGRRGFIILRTVNA